MAARTMELQECIRHDNRKMWLEMIEMAGQAIPVCYYAERIPYLQFDAQDRVLMISVRADQYGVTWRCWDEDPREMLREKQNEAILESVDAGKKSRTNGPGVKTAERIRKAAAAPAKPAGKKAKK